MNDKIPVIIEMSINENILIFKGLFEPPKIETDIIAIPYMSLNTYMAGRAKWSNAKLTFYDCNSLDEFNWIHTWTREHTDWATGRMGYNPSPKKDVVITKINNFNGVIERWVLIGACINTVNTKLVYEFDDTDFSKIISNNLTRKVLFEKSNNPTLQILIDMELSVDTVIIRDN